MKNIRMTLLLFIAFIPVQMWPTQPINETKPEKPVFEVPPAARTGLVPITAKQPQAAAHSITPPGANADEAVIELAAHAIPHDNTGEPAKPGRPILGKGTLSAQTLVEFLINENKDLDKQYIKELVELYIIESELEGVNHDIAFAQMLLETGFLRFGGLVSPEQNNFCGLGATGPGVSGNSFPTVEMGIRAHVQHLQAYATDIPLNQELVDPRYHFVRRGSVPHVEGLAGTWAADRRYADKLEGILARLFSLNVGDHEKK